MIGNLYEVDDDGKLKLSLHKGQSKAWESDKRFVFVLSGTQGGKCLVPTALVLLSDGTRKMVSDIRAGLS